MANKIVEKLKKELTSKYKYENAQSRIVFDRIRDLLEKQNKNVEWLALEMGFKHKNSLYVGFKIGSISIDYLTKIAKILNVHPFYFFENEIIERLSDEVRTYNDNHEVKSFISGLSQELNKGMKLEEATSKVIDPKGHFIRLIS